MNEELKLILYSLRQKIMFGNGTTDNLCKTMTDKPVLDDDGDIVMACANIWCLNCYIYQDYTYAAKVIHVWHQL